MRKPRTEVDRENERRRYRARLERETPETRAIRKAKLLAKNRKWRANQNDEGREAKKEQQRRYSKSAKGKANKKRYEQTATRRAYQKWKEAKRHPAFGTKLYKEVVKAIPRGIPDFKRDDIASDVIEKLLTAKRLSDNIAILVKEAIKRNNAMFSDFEKSLDDVVGENGFTRGQAMGIY